jgi:hypothetical protein
MTRRDCEPIDAGGSAPPVIASPVVTDHATGERRTDRAYTEAGMMSLREYVEKWGSAQ